MADGATRTDHDALEREVIGLRLRVVELQRAAARHEKTDGVSLAEREELLRDAERVAHLGTWTWDVESGRVTWSDELHRILGIEPGSVTPSVDAFMTMVHPDDLASARAAAEKSARDGSLAPNDCRIVRPDGSVRHTRTSTVMLFDVEGNVRGIVGGVLDRTESLEAEAAQERMREELAHAQKMEAVGRLAGGIAHDFNNLLTVIIANLDLLGGRIGPCPEIDNSLQALSSAASLTRRLLAFGRKAQLSLKLVAPNMLVRSMGTLMQRLVGDEVRIELDLAPDLPQVRVDPLEMERALVNLVVNARDAMPNGGVVHIATRLRNGEATAQVEFSVGDEGPGIDESVRPHIFEPFYTTRKESGGTGLGLATVLGTAEQHGGSVRVDGRPGGGSVFTIILPAAEVLDGSRVMYGAANKQTRQPLRPLHVLVIDDEVKVADVTGRILKARGHSVTVTTQPDQALRLWTERGTEIDLVICDVVMAQMRGPELVARMSARGTKPRVLFMTGYSEEAVHAALEHPVLPKPFTAEDLMAAVASAVGESA
jgi:PAS domain S-box-containing protein